MNDREEQKIKSTLTHHTQTVLYTYIFKQLYMEILSRKKIIINSKNKNFTNYYFGETMMIFLGIELKQNKIVLY